MNPIRRHKFRAMASPCELHLITDDERQFLQAAHAIEQEVLRIEAKYSRYRDDSVLSQINQNAGQPTPIDQETWYLLNYARICFQQSDGLFDISSGVLRQAWNFRQPALPEETQLAPLLKRIGFDRSPLSQDQFQMPDDMEIDLGGIGKEYAADRAASICKQFGISSGIIDLGGDLLVLGPKPENSPWLLGVRHPRDPENAFAQLPVYEGGMASSGDYERFFVLDSHRYCHLLNPHTGFPVNYWASITVLAPSCLLAGTFSTIAMLKQQEALPWLDEQGLHYLAIRPDGSHVSSSAGAKQTN